jgi:hypothetical protein
MNAKRIFDSEGVEIFDIETLKTMQNVYISGVISMIKNIL